MTVNPIVSGKAYIRTKIRGHGEKHYVRVFEDNQARTTYLGMYGIIDTIDAAINRYRLGNAYRCWKYYHTPANVAKAMTLNSSYSFYAQMVDGSLAPEWYINKKERMSPHQFQ